MKSPSPLHGLPESTEPRQLSLDPSNRTTAGTLVLDLVRVINDLTPYTPKDARQINEAIKKTTVAIVKFLIRIKSLFGSPTFGKFRQATQQYAIITAVAGTATSVLAVAQVRQACVELLQTHATSHAQDYALWGPDAQSCATSMALLVFPMLAVFDRALLSFNARCLVRRSPLAVAAGAHRAYTTAGDDLHTVTDGWEGFLSKLDRRKQRLIIRLCQLWKESFAPKVVSSKGHKKIADTHQRELAAALQQALDAVADRRRAAAGLTNIQRGATLNPVYAMLGKECDQSLAAVAALKAERRRNPAKIIRPKHDNVLKDFDAWSASQNIADRMYAGAERWKQHMDIGTAHLDDKTGMKLMNLDEAQRKFGNTATRQTRIIGDDFKPVRTVEEERDPDGLREELRQIDVCCQSSPTQSIDFREYSFSHPTLYAPRSLSPLDDPFATEAACLTPSASIASISTISVSESMASLPSTISYAHSGHKVWLAGRDIADSSATPSLSTVSTTSMSVSRSQTAPSTPPAAFTDTSSRLKDDLAHAMADCMAAPLTHVHAKSKLPSWRESAGNIIAPKDAASRNNEIIGMLGKARFVLRDCFGWQKQTDIAVRTKAASPA